ncbi:hypothetical protein CYPRO_2402 [Cyclonatronum proteinivorum]|uniref:Uncharacterized protein n=1 Tax=Cyclonatronum proteinivorum TaxID=1457365 RepID=A0A345UME2_9BACT|nr:hypothetical protein CYPRO_2402 [Cyclonatronum proteinivorum]
MDGDVVKTLRNARTRGFDPVPIPKGWHVYSTEFRTDIHDPGWGRTRVAGEIVGCAVSVFDGC